MASFTLVALVALAMHMTLATAQDVEPYGTTQAAAPTQNNNPAPTDTEVPRRAPVSLVTTPIAIGIAVGGMFSSYFNMNNSHLLLLGTLQWY